MWWFEVRWGWVLVVIGCCSLMRRGWFVVMELESGVLVEISRYRNEAI